MRPQDDVLGTLVRGASEDESIRVVILTSSRTDPARSDELSDYDVILVVTDAPAFGQQDAWQSGFGVPMVGWGDESGLHGIQTYFRLVVYEDETRSDYMICPVELLERVVQHQHLPDALDVGYRVLVDKDSLGAAASDVHRPRARQANRGGVSGPTRGVLVGRDRSGQRPLAERLDLCASPSSVGVL
jgi:Streptomycin adenylyltransferase